MKNIIIIFFFLFFKNLAYSKNIAYLDIQFIIDNSNLGKAYKSEILNIQTKMTSDLKEKKILIKEKENELNNQKNVLKKKNLIKD